MEELEVVVIVDAPGKYESRVTDELVACDDTSGVARVVVDDNAGSEAARPALMAMEVWTQRRKGEL